VRPGRTLPADREGARLYPGDIIQAVDGVKLTRTTNLYELLTDKIDKPVELEVKGKNGKIRYVEVRPISYSRFLSLEYDRWVEEKRQKVHKWSNNRIGYLHIRGMNQPSLERFEMELYAEGHNKEAIVIDVRNNGGGWTTDYLLAILQARPHAFTIPRDGEKGYPQGRRPLYAWSKPIIVLANEFSYSNAEIFSHAIKTLKLGKVVGQTTFGAVISTGGIQLIDGSRFRTPFRGWYVYTTGINMENNGCVPDIIVPVKPGEVARHIDNQLKVAVEELMKEL